MSRSLSFTGEAIHLIKYWEENSKDDSNAKRVLI